MNYKRGENRRIHPATDLFMRGVAYAVVEKIGPKWITLRHMMSDTTHRVSKKFMEENTVGANEQFPDKWRES